MLDDATVLLGGLHQFTSFVDIVGKRLFDVNVLARLAGPDGHETVPMVGGGHGNDVYFLVF